MEKSQTKKSIMKNLFTLILFVLLAGSLLSSRHAVAQAPDKMSYQAVIRDTEGNLVTEEEIGMQISILQGSADGIVVYTETQTPLTNGNGLVSIKIGGEAGFADIDWSDGPYFIKTETDPEGGTNYTITGTSQLLSVPYALHSGSSEVLIGEITESQISDLQTYYLASNPDGFITAYIVTEEDVTAHESALSISESQITDLQSYLTSITGQSIGDLSDVDLTGIEAGKVLKYDAVEEMWVIADDLGITEEEDPIFTSSEAFNITDAGSGKVITDAERDKLDGIDGSETKVTAGTNITVTGTGTEADPYIVNAATGGATTYEIGDEAHGGVVFYVEDCGTKGLVAAIEDWNGGATIQWRSGSTNYITKAKGDEVYAGKMNTAIIISVSSVKDASEDHAA